MCVRNCYKRDGGFNLLPALLELEALPQRTGCCFCRGDCHRTAELTGLWRGVRVCFLLASVAFFSSANSDSSYFTTTSLWRYLSLHSG